MQNKHFISGSIYWPLLPLEILRNEMVPFLSFDELEKETKIICPCITKISNGNENCLFNSENGCVINTNNRKQCKYNDYHKFFLLIDDSVKFPSCEIYNDNLRNNVKSPQNSYDKLYASNLKKNDFISILNYSPQYCPTLNQISNDLRGLEIAKHNLLPNTFFRNLSDQKPLYAGDLKKVESEYAKFYIKSEYHTSPEKIDSDSASSLFEKLIKITPIKDILPEDTFNVDNGDLIHPVLLSFFADKRVDALLSLVVRHGNKKTTKKLIEQALGSIHNEIYKQRQEFLENWCMTLGERVDDIYHEEIKARSDDTDGIRYKPDYAQRQEEAKKNAMEFALEAILRMTRILAAEKFNAKDDNKANNAKVDGIVKSFIYSPNSKSSGQISKHIEKYYIDSIQLDRKKYVIDFCKKAEMYAEEFVSSEGKLKGRLSASTVKKLKNISQTSNPVNARILIQGEAGGGKGVTADDFHFYCMKKIVEQINNGVNDYIDEIEKRLDTIFKLPANYSTSATGASANLFFRQITNTGWWLWNESKNKCDLENEIGNLLGLQKGAIENLKGKNDASKKYFEKDGACYQTKLIDGFVKLLKKKILWENESEKPDFSFNMLQVNCGILGGENSELSESIARLFGTSGDYETAKPGLFQTCSYMGGTLFLDEIADAPVRVQDNLLRPLEEGKVSRPGWETFDEEVDNIRIVGATFKDLVKLAQQYQETLPSGDPKGFRPDLLTRLTRNPPVFVTPVWKYFVPTKQIDDDFPSQFAFVLNNSWEVSSEFWREVYYIVSKQIDEYRKKSRHHISGVYEGRRKYASKITMRLFKEVGKIARLNAEPDEKPKKDDPQIVNAKKYLSRMLDYLLVETN